MNKINLILIFLVCLVLGVIIFFKIDNKEKKQDLVKINNSSFTLNDVANKFLESSYAKENKCKVKILSDSMNIKCNNVNDNYLFNKEELEVVTNKNGLEVFKYLVNGLEELHGYEKDEYLNTITRFINNEISINGLWFYKQDDGIHLKVLLNEKLQKDKELEVLHSEEIKKIDDVGYEYENNNYRLTGFRISTDESMFIYAFDITFSGPDFNKYVLVKYFDNNKKLLQESKVLLSDCENYGNDYLNLVVTTNFNEVDFRNVNYYSISLI